jgi:hypothetical protein
MVGGLKYPEQPQQPTDYDHDYVNVDVDVHVLVDVVVIGFCPRPGG